MGRRKENGKEMEREEAMLEATNLNREETTPLVHPHLNRRRNLKHARRLLYLSHCFAQFSERAWQFALSLFLAAFTNYQSLILVSMYGLIDGLTVCLLGAAAGRFVDGSNRLFAARFLIWTENVSVLIATFCCYLLLSMNQGRQVPDEPSADANWIERHFHGVPLDASSILLLLGMFIFGPMATILDRAFLVAIERDWVVVMSEEAADDVAHSEPDKIWLSETNVAMKQIDLSCKVSAPAVAGFIIAAFDDPSSKQHGADLTGAAVLVGVVNVAALVVEFICTAKIYYLIPALAIKEAPIQQTQSKKNKMEVFDVLPGTKKKRDLGCGLIRLPEGLRIYLEQPISWSGLGLAMLYLNVLTFGSLMTAYLVWRGMRLETVGIWRGISAAAGLAGTFVYHFSVKRTTLVNTGMWSIVYEFACLSLSFASLFVHNFDISMVMLIAGVCASRIGLWVFDITVTQLMQEFVPAGIRGVVGGMQQALNSFFSLLSFAIGLIFPDPKDFHIYVAAGYLAIGVAMILYLLKVYMRATEFLTSSERSYSV